jgi:hypothetical protein
MPNPFAKTRQLHKPYAIFINNQGWQWRVLKTYKQPSSEAKDKFARWYVAAISPMTDMRWEYGDTYATERGSNELRALSLLAPISRMAQSVLNVEGYFKF